MSLRSFFYGVFALCIVLYPSSANACAVCFGAPDDPMTKGMQWGIATLIFVLVPVFSGVGGFFIFLAKRAKDFEPFQDPDLFRE